MSLALESPVAFHELVELLRSGPRGTLAVAVCDSMPHARGLIALLREQLGLKLVEASFGERQRTLFDLLDAYRLRAGDVLCLLELQRATEGTWRSLDMQRELLAERQVSAVCWVTRSAQRDLAVRAPNFYAFRTLLLDFTESTEPDPSRYLLQLRDATATIDIRGLTVGRGRSARFPLDQWYLGLHATGRFADGRLERLLEHRRLLVVGDPGCGKTTFLRWVALTLSKAWLGQSPEAAEQRLGLSSALFPVLLRAAELDAYLSSLRAPSDIASEQDLAAGLLLDYLAWLAEENLWELDREFFERRLTEDGCTVLLDGLDELPDVAARQRMVRLMDEVASAYAQSRFVVTTRPAALSDEVRLADWTYAYVEPLADDAVQEFLQRWCAAVYPDSPEAARTHEAELRSAVAVRPEIRQMARNPVMLTALVVVHWNEKRLPEQRADLYESIILWLSRSRQQRHGRLAAERTVAILGDLALKMQCHAAGRQSQVSRKWAVEAIRDSFADRPDPLAAAQAFLHDEELDSGIIVGRGLNVCFWHLTFQEYLAARTIAGLRDVKHERLLLDGPEPRLYQPEWREVFLLLTGSLYHHGIERMDGFFSSVFDRLTNETSLAKRARGVGLLGAAAQELAVLNYRVADPRYPRLLDDVLGIFDAARCREVPIDVAIEAAEALGQAGDPRFVARDAEGLWVAVPAGSFWMGAQDAQPAARNYDPDAMHNERPVHRVELPAYRIGRYPVTVAEYRKFLEDGGYENPSWWTAGGFGLYAKPEDWQVQLRHPTRPVTWVCWYEAQAYCRWAGCRLPSEAEWEHAARGDDGRRYPWGDAPPDATRMNYAGQIGSPTPVGVYPLGNSPLGIADLAGNVWEWCEDAYGPYGQNGPKPSRPTGAQIERVVRGGAWHGQAIDCRVSARSPLRPDHRDVHVGFRVVRTLPESDRAS